MSNNQLSGEVFYPSEEVINYDHLKSLDEFDKLAEMDNEKFWENFAEELHWFKRWDRVLDNDNPPFLKWFTGGKTNISYNCLDAHVKTHRRNKLALLWEGESGEFIPMSYHNLHKKVSKFANVLKGLNLTGTKSVFVLDGADKNTLLSARNLPTVSLSEAKNLNIFEIMNCKKLVLSEAAVKSIESNFSNN